MTINGSMAFRVFATAADCLATEKSLTTANVDVTPNMNANMQFKAACGYVDRFKTSWLVEFGGNLVQIWRPYMTDNQIKIASSIKLKTIMLTSTQNGGLLRIHTT